MDAEAKRLLEKIKKTEQELYAHIDSMNKNYFQHSEFDRCKEKDRVSYNFINIGLPEGTPTCLCLNCGRLM
jgi:hypothetical protein